MRVLYIKSDFLFLFLYYIVGYRKKIILKNLELAFPNKNQEELLTIRKKFYKHFTDLLVESIKSFTISEKEITKRYRFTNPEIVNDFYAKGRNIVLVGAHQGNWEWSINMPLFFDITVFGAYTRIKNKYFDKVIKNTREKFGVRGYKTSLFIEMLKENIKNKIPGLYILLSDQSPALSKTHYWTEFMGIKVPVHTGAEMLAKKFDMVVINYSIKKVKRGYYEATLETLTDNPKEFENYQITDKYLRITEENIKQQPEYYLWSHRRFKHRDKVPEKWQ